MRNYILILVMLCTATTVNSQAKNDWPTIPGIDPALPLTLNNRNTLIGVASVAALSYALEEFVFKNHDNTNFYTARIGMNNEYGWGLKYVALQNFGFEHRPASWFSVSAEFNLQEIFDSTPNINTKDKFGLGIGVMTYYRWYLLGRKRISPYLEYGTGIFIGFDKFPYNGSNFTFNQSTQVGIEYKTKTDSRFRISYGNIHQSNYGLCYSDPGYNANGFLLSFSWEID